MKTYKVGMLGFGFIGKVHAYGHLNIPLFYEQQDFRSQISKVCTSKAETARQAAELLGSAQPVNDFRQITEDPEIDIIDICTPNNLHCEELLSAIQQQKHIYCDKPLTATWEEAQQIKEALKNYRGISQMTLQNRFFPVTMRAKQLIEEGRLGEILEFRASYLHSGSADPKAPLKWKLSGAAGGGVVADLGSHILDLMHYLLGNFQELSAATRIAYPERPSAEDPARMLKVDAEDSMQVTMRLANGAIGLISASKIATGSEDEVSFEIYGNKGAIKLLPMDWHRLYFYDTAAMAKPLGGVRGWTAVDCGQRYDKPAGFPTPKASIGWMRGHMHCLYTFLNSVHTGKAVGPTLDQGVYIQYLMEKVKESANKKQWIALNY
ncbi:MAG: Gfo/Idh/MocA family oxidoreductase [Lentisphaeria bacterium]|nr:Gfo/Idh/MocA family oxidoreductase [Lentisphaeria bacterium]